MKKLALTAAFVIAASTSAQALDKNTIGIGVGAIDVFDNNYREAAGTIQWRGKAFDASSTMGIGNISPHFGVEADVEGGLYGYGGFLYDWQIADRWSILPSVAVGLYHDGDGKDLGGAIEFRSALELSYKVDERNRVGASLSHISNASIYDRNPGKEDIFVTYSYAY